ncbi:hypothetical protein ACFL27_21535 [candidate division CSSED10-310 bacterium]|uniref:Response regulatory domain-containing protein n=1 Tax=candidate division CSSED10-310 bacterium TaxID=2855610 RepID=A0ABV6Z2W1_UNCC1
MRFRNLMVIDDAEMIRDTLKRYILSELNDTSVWTESSTQQAFEKVYDQKFEAIIMTREILQSTPPELLNNLSSSPLNQDTPCIIMSKHDPDKNIPLLDASQIRYFTVSSFLELRAVINQISDPRAWREAERISIPDTKAILKLNNQELEVSIINFSLSGILGELTYAEFCSGIMRSRYITLILPPPYDNITIPDLWCKLLTIECLEWKNDELPSKIRVIWNIVSVKQKQKDLFQQVFEKVQLDMTASENNVINDV